ncbi:MerR family transcriptional regulator [Clostridium sp. CM028]|uniref:MerR family transcriptional regulator n=1 Tax=unclassified Clostridium TaxID=2614128 RepID=UPI001C0E7D3B|nr:MULTISPECIES: MerR family transcriptional regulator [unclassified Clostridium]MBU3093701.1 MerR family transcriptional regulator [Clostridium sp. CF011]MBW9149976.1 MerR family transcriptional regulator [Clostridium sp. CM028]WAG70875.1 MerR family transcriptional regulator [Clostridium sp. CF011]WLC62497.1 MerR family transcriptional regulator [Clostridium sp. CM028]
MGTNFSIGEMSKLQNISVQTLRYYDKIGLLKPSYIDEKSRYRYYSAKHFVILNSIKQCKAMGLSLDEIKELIENYTSFDSILNIISKQKEMIDTKIKDLNAVKNNISFLEKRIKNSLKEGINDVFIKYNKERKFKKYNNTKRYTEEFEINLSEILVSMEQKYSSSIKELAFAVSYEDIKKYNELIYNNMLINGFECVTNDDNLITLPKGEYITLNFDDDYNDTSKYYKSLIEYIDRNNIEVSGDFYEIYIMTRVGNDGEERSLGQIQILKKK